MYTLDLRPWSGCTDILKTKQGGKVLKPLSGVAKDALQDLEVEDILKDDGLDTILNSLDEAFNPFLGQTMPKAFEKAVYQGKREKGEMLHAYTVAETGKVQ